MKKLITILAIAAIAVTSTFASITPATTSFDGSKASAPEMNVTLKSTLEQTPYKLSILYGVTDFTEAQTTTLTGLNLTKASETSLFNVMITEGNLNKTVTFVTTITTGPFIGTVDGDSDYHTANILSILGSDFKAHEPSFSSSIPAGPQVSQSVASFSFAWTADEALPAGSYVSTNKINISVI
jgi:hypothetical protein